MTSNLVRTFRKFHKYKWDSYTLWSDFIEMAAISIANTADRFQSKNREERYLQISNKYTKNEMTIFSEMMADLVMDLEENPHDVLGEAFMELELGNKWKGQFFTPYPVAYIMAQTTLTKETIQKAVNKNGFVAVNDDACGGGVTLIAAFNWIRELGFNPQQMLVIEGSDVDARSCYMSYIQLSLLGANAVIRQRDALDRIDKPDDATWFTPFYILGGWRYKRKSVKQKSDIKTVTDDDGQVSFLVSEVS